MSAHRTRLLLALAGILALGGVVLWPAMRRLHRIDACLDGGGSWDYSARVCRAAIDPSRAPTR